MTSIIGDFHWTKRRHLGAVLLAISAVIALVGVPQQRAQAAPIAIAFDLSSAVPSSYNHALGGGAWNDGPNATGATVSDEHSAQDFACGDIQSYFMAVTTDTTVGLDAAPRTVQLDLIWDAASGLFPGAGYTDIVRTRVNYGPVTAGAGLNGEDIGIKDDGGSTSRIAAETLTDAYQPGGKLRATIEVDDVEINEQIIVRIDVRLSCKTDADHAGILYTIVDQGFSNTGAREVSPEPRDLQVAQLRQQLLQVVLLSNADFTATLTPNPASLVAPGGPVTYSVSIANNRPSLSLLIDDVVDSGIGALSHAGAATTCQFPWLIGPGQSASCTFTSIVTGAANTSVVTQIVATGGGSTRSANASVALTADPRLQIVKAVQGSTDVDQSGSYTAGDVLTFVLIATNTGNVTLTGVVLTDALAGTSPVNCGSFNGSLGVGNSISCTTAYTITAGNGAALQVTNTASADSNETAATATSITVRLAGPAALSITMTTSPAGPFKVGDDVTVNIDVCNTGGSTMTGVTLKEPSLGIDQPLGSIGNAQCQRVTRVYKVTSADALNTNHAFNATADSDQTDPGSALATIVVQANRSLAIAVSTPVTTVEEGTEITYTVKVSNGSDVPLGDVSVSDSFGGLNEMLAGMTIGDVRSFTVTHTPTAAEVSAGKVLYTANAGANGVPAVSATATVDVTTKPLPKPVTTLPAAPPAPKVTVVTRLPVTGTAETATYLMWSLALATAGLALLVGGRRRNVIG